MAEIYSNDAKLNDTMELPWLIFTLGENAYAINSKYVNGIEMKPSKITPLPEAPDIYCGLVERRGEVYPLLNMRKTFHFPTIDEEVAAFAETMEQRKKDHLYWIDKLESCVETGEKFNLATDPRLCAFGKWYDNFIAENRSAGLNLKKVEEPHKKLHEMAPEVIELAENGQLDKARKLIAIAREDYVPRVLKVLDEAEHAYRSTFRETVVVLSDGIQMLGLLVDRVLAVDKVTFINGSGNMNLLMQSKFFESVARNDKFDMEILVVNEDELLKLSDVEK